MDPIVNECQYFKFLKRRQDHMLMFGYVHGVRNNLPSVSVRKAIGQYLDFFNIDGDVRALENEFTRMVKELREADRG
jgi:hypothetical protein